MNAVEHANRMGRRGVNRQALLREAYAGPAEILCRTCKTMQPLAQFQLYRSKRTGQVQDMGYCNACRNKRRGRCEPKRTETLPTGPALMGFAAGPSGALVPLNPAKVYRGPTGPLLKIVRVGISFRQYKRSTQTKKKRAR